MMICVYNSISSAQKVDSVIILDAVEIESYQISGTIRTIPGSISVLSGNDLTYSDQTNLSDVFRKLPGIHVQSGTFTTNRIVIRGMGSRTPYNTNRIRTYLNDIPLTTSDGLSSPEEMEAETIGRAEIIRGPSSALYGSGLGGNISLYTPSDTAKKISLALQYGSFGTWKVSGSASIHPDKWVVYRNTSHLQTDRYRENSKYSRTSMLNSASWHNKHWKVDLLLWMSRVRGEIPSSLGITEFTTHPEHAAQNWKTIKGYKKYFRFLGGISATYSNQLSFTQKLIIFARGIDHYEKRPFNNLDDHSFGTGIRSKSTWHWNKSDLVLGTELLYDQYVWKLDTSKIRINKNRERRNQINIFAIWYYHPHPKLTLSMAGALNLLRYKRFDLFQDDGDDSGIKQFPLVFSPRLGINFAANRIWSVYFSAGRGFSQPSPEESVNPDGSVNNSIKHETGYQFEAGSRLAFLNNRLFTEGTVYWIELNDLLVTKRISEELFTGINAGKTRHRGLELTCKGRILNRTSFPGSLTALVSYTRSWNAFIHFTDDEIRYDGKMLPGIPRYTTYFELEWSPVIPLEWHIDFLKNGRQYMNDDNTLQYQEYAVFNTKIACDIDFKKSWNLRLYAGINNVFNEQYASMLVINAKGFGGNEPRFYYPGLPRMFYAGVAIEF